VCVISTIKGTTFSSELSGASKPIEFDLYCTALGNNNLFPSAAAIFLV
jgi:hypothetical protein